MHVEQNFFDFVECELKRHEVELKRRDFPPILSLQDGEHLSNVIEVLQVSICREDVTNLSEVLNVLLLKGKPSEVRQLLVLLHQLFEVVEVEVGVHQIAERSHATHVNGVHLWVNCLCVLVVLLLPVLEDVDKFLPPGGVTILIEPFDHIGCDVVPQIANGTSACIGIVVCVV